MRVFTVSFRLFGRRLAYCATAAHPVDCVLDALDKYGQHLRGVSVRPGVSNAARAAARAGLDNNGHQPEAA